jgi:hypothetical protein
VNAPRRSVLSSIAADVERRTIGAGLASLGMLLGLFVLSFLWLGARMDRHNPRPGAAARVLVTVDPDFREPITLRAGSPLHLDEASSATRSVWPVRETLERLAARQRLSKTQQTDLEKYLHRGVPAQTLSWIVRSDTPGSFPVMFVLPKARLIVQFVAFGDQSPPPDDQSVRHHPIQSVKVESAASQPALWNFTGIRLLNREVGWRWIYLGAYLSAWLLFRRLMRLA